MSDVRDADAVGGRPLVGRRRGARGSQFTCFNGTKVHILTEVERQVAHSWTGNLVTNASWEHFWLNEGWTVWLERRIMMKVRGGAAGK